MSIHPLLPLPATLAQPLWLPAAIRQHEGAAAEAAGLTLSALMAEAGAAVLAAARHYFPAARCYLLLCGGGNNGGDGYVAARLALLAGLEVRLVAAVDPARLTGDAAAAHAAFVAAGGECLPWQPALLEGVDLIIDALLGSGGQGALRPELVAICRAINAKKCPLLAVDLPTGLDGSSGMADADSLRASLTLTFLAAKPGLFTGRGPSCSGQVVLAPLLAQGLLAQQQAAFGWLLPAHAQALPPRSLVGHKGLYGKLLLVGGGSGMAGAARLCGEAALRGGVGLVAVACGAGSAAAISGPCPELMADERPELLAARLAWASLVVVGPGLGRDAWAASCWQQVVATDLPLLVDGDALWWLAQAPQRRENWVLTPHPGEAATLLGWPLATVEADRPAAARALQQRYGGVVVLKGAGTLVVDGQQLWLSPWSLAALASAGMGDLLAGIIAAGWAQGLAAVDAACRGVILHADAASRAAAGDERGLLARDLLPWVRKLSNEQCQLSAQ